MKNACTFLLGLLLSVCLTLYGPTGMAKAGSGAVFSMEICADGVAKTVLFDIDGNPVEPAQSCPECLTCCQAISTLTPTICSKPPSDALLGMNVDRFSAQNPIFNKRNIHPAPRGPPAVHFSMFSMSALIMAGRSDIDQITHSDGRPLLKDANA